MAAELPRDCLHPAPLKWAAESALAERWLVAFSGGADSLALLLLLWAHWPERRRCLRVVHFNHRLRGAAADRDEAFCAKVCAELGVWFAAGRWVEPPTRPSEAEARAARHAFFRRQLSRFRAWALWLGHQQDDIAETLLMRLARGSGTAGLAAPRPAQSVSGGVVHLRPLLTLPKREIARVLKRCGVTWREDATNDADLYFRTRIRRTVIPRWVRSAVDRDALAGAALSRELLQEDDEALAAWLAELSPLRRDGSLDLSALRGKPKALVRRALHDWLARQPEATDVSRQCFVALIDHVMAGRTTKQSLGSGRFAMLSKDELRMLSGKLPRSFQRRVN